MEREFWKLLKIKFKSEKKVNVNVNGEWVFYMYRKVSNMIKRRTKCIRKKRVNKRIKELKKEQGGEYSPLTHSELNLILVF